MHLAQSCSLLLKYNIEIKQKLFWEQWYMLAGVSLTIATFCNLLSPVITGILFEILTKGQTFSAYPKFLAVLGTLYIVEPLVTRVYIKNACAAGEKVCYVLQVPKCHCIATHAYWLACPNCMPITELHHAF